MVNQVMNIFRGRDDMETILKLSKRQQQTNYDMFEEKYDEILLKLTHDEDRKSPTIVTLPHLLKKFRNSIELKTLRGELDEKMRRVQLTPPELTSTLQILEQLLNFISISMNSPNFYKEIAIQINIGEPKTTSIYLEFFSGVYMLFKQSSNRLIQYLAGNLLRILLKFPGKKLDIKIESLNKNLLLTDKYKMNFMVETIRHLSSVSIKQDQDTITDCLSKNDFSICLTLNIFECFINDRKYTTTDEDLSKVFKWMNNVLGFQILSQISRSNSLYASYKSSLLINALIKSLEQSHNRIKEYQELILHNST